MPLTGSELQDTNPLEKNDMLRGLEPSGLARIAQGGRVRRLKAGAYLFRQGTPATNLYILIVGSIKMTQLTPKGHQVLVRVVSPGENIGATVRTRLPNTQRVNGSE